MINGRPLRDRRQILSHFWTLPSFYVSNRSYRRRPPPLTKCSKRSDKTHNPRSTRDTKIKTKCGQNTYIVYFETLLQSQIKSRQVDREDFFACFLGTENSAQSPDGLGSAALVALHFVRLRIALLREGERGQRGAAFAGGRRRHVGEERAGPLRRRWLRSWTDQNIKSVHRQGLVQECHTKRHSFRENLS